MTREIDISGHNSMRPHPLQEPKVEKYCSFQDAFNKNLRVDDFLPLLPTSPWCHLNNASHELEQDGIPSLRSDKLYQVFDGPGVEAPDMEAPCYGIQSQVSQIVSHAFFANHDAVSAFRRILVSVISPVSGGWKPVAVHTYILPFLPRNRC